MRGHEKKTDGDINPLPDEIFPYPESRVSLDLRVTNDHQIVDRPHTPMFKFPALSVGCRAAMHVAALAE